MKSRLLIVLAVTALAGSGAMAQDTVQNPPRGTNFATVGRPPVPTVLGGRIMERAEDRFDRHPCCGYGKTNNDMGVPGFRSQFSFYWGGACEYFREGCQRPTAPNYNRRNGAERLIDEMFGSGGCQSCGK